MNLTSPLLPILLGLMSFAVSHQAFESFGLHIRDWPQLSIAMYLAVALGLFINVSDIDRTALNANRTSIASVLLVGVPIKILLPGALLSFFLMQPTQSFDTGIAFLCATVIAQIDPILAAKNIDHKRFSNETSTILRCWSSFDDPITVLFAFYIFLPRIIEGQADRGGQYALSIFIEVIVCYVFYLLFNKDNPVIQPQKTTGMKLFVILICIVSGLFGKFLPPAFLGLLLRPLTSRTKSILLDVIFVFSIVIIGALSVDVSFNWIAGILLGMSTFVLAQPLVTAMFIRKGAWCDRLRVMAGHQNGMTAILLTISIELKLDNVGLLPITLPAILFIALLYYASNFWLDQNVSCH